MIVIVMGVTGAGKTTVGQSLAEQLGWEFIEGDKFHPPENIEKMRQGIPLNDDDRKPWLERLHAEIARRVPERRSVVLACSALKSEYRRVLTVGEEVKFVYLKGSREHIAERLRTRLGHFADENILAGQFADLEEPEGAITVSVAETPQAIVQEIREKLGL
jgi:gluconokinase